MHLGRVHHKTFIIMTKRFSQKKNKPHKNRNFNWKLNFKSSNGNVFFFRGIIKMLTVDVKASSEHLALDSLSYWMEWEGKNWNSTRIEQERYQINVISTIFIWLSQIIITVWLLFIHFDLSLFSYELKNDRLSIKYRSLDDNETLNHHIFSRELIQRWTKNPSSIKSQLFSRLFCSFWPFIIPDDHVNDNISSMICAFNQSTKSVNYHHTARLTKCLSSWYHKRWHNHFQIKLKCK